MGGLQNQFMVVGRWAVSFITRGRSSRLITAAGLPRPPAATQAEPMMVVRHPAGWVGPGGGPGRGRGGGGGGLGGCGAGPRGAPRGGEGWRGGAAGVEGVDQVAVGVVGFSARRLCADRVGLLFTVREGEGRAGGLAGLPELVLGGLPGEAAGELVAASAGARVDGRVSAQIVSGVAG